MFEAKEELKILKEQLSILESYLKSRPEVKDRGKELNKYREYLEQSKSTLREPIEPTSFVGRLRRKGAFY